MNALTYVEVKPRSQPTRLQLLGFAVVLAASGVALYAVAGPPHLPSRLPNWQTILVTLQGSDVPLDALSYIFTTAAWIVWLWIVGSLVLRLIVGIAEMLSHGAEWARTLHRLSDRVTLPIVRKLADGAIVAMLVVNLAARAPSAAAAPLDAPAPIVAVVSHAPDRPPPSATTSRTTNASKETDYTVQPGDTLWTIAERFYGTGEEYPRVIAANAGRTMSDGRRFERTGVIQPGWHLRIPLPSKAVTDVGGKAVYVVEQGDTLRGIAARFLGDENRWPEIFDPNKGNARLSDGRTLSNPDLIWPGLRLTLSMAIHEDQPPAPPPVPKAVEPAQTVQPPQTVQPVATETWVPSAPTEVPQVPSPVSTPLPSVTPIVKRRKATAVNAAPPFSANQSPSLAVDGAVGLAIAGAAALLVRRRVRRSLREPPVPMPPPPRPNDEFAEAGFAGALRRRLQDGQVDPVTLLTWQVLDALATNGVTNTPVVMARQERNAVTMTLAASLAVQDRIVELAEEIGHGFGGIGRAEFTPDHDVAVRISSLALARLGPPPASPPTTPLCFLPLGVLSGQEILWANWTELRHVLIAGLPGGGPDVIFASLLAALAAHRRPDELRLWTVARRTTVPDQLRALPHQEYNLVDPDEEQVRSLLDDLRAELLRRMRGGEQAEPDVAHEPEIVLLVDEMGTLPRDDTTMELIGVHGPAHGIRVIATTTNAATLADLLPHFTTRLVLQTLDDEESIQLLGRPEGADLGSADVFVRIDAREPVRVRGFQVSPEHLDELVALMDAAYGPQCSDARRDPRAETVAASSATSTDEQHNAIWTDGPDAITPERPVGRKAETVELEDDSDELTEMDSSAIVIDDRMDPISSQVADAVAAALARASNRADDGSLSVSGKFEPLDGAAGAIAADPGQMDAGLEQMVASLDAEHVESPSPEPDGQDRSQALVDVHCFGEFSVRSGDREITPSIDERVSFKAWEILAFLAAQPGGVTSRERLMTAVWPDMDSDRAANRMRVEMTRLRAILARQVPGLPGDVVRCERTGVCSLDMTAVSSDVHRFIALCRSAVKLPPEQAATALAEALALYRDDLLIGRGAYFYEWAEERGEDGATLRDQFRDEYVRATRRLAQLYCRAGQPALAVPLYKNLLKTEPTLEDVVRELFRCYQQLGDIGALVREERHLREALREGYSDPENRDDVSEAYPPERETTELFEAIRSELEAGAVGVNGHRSHEAA